VREASPYKTVDDVNRKGVRVVSVEGTATLRSCRRSLSKTAAEGVGKLDDALTLFKQGKVDAVALGKESLRSLLATLPGATLTSGSFHAAGTAVGVPKGHSDALEAASAFIEHAKSAGLVRQAFDRHGMASSDVASPGSRS
jgi:polar amino acid transport system substrate-binding protein